jgi:hypothetical protein
MARFTIVVSTRMRCFDVSTCVIAQFSGQALKVTSPEGDCEAFGGLGMLEHSYRPGRPPQWASESCMTDSRL